MRNLVAFADRYALGAHGHQKRKYTGEPYINHPREVRKILERAGFTDPNILAAALLHDVVEDCAVTLARIRHAFGVRVATLVEQVTDVSRPEDGNRAVRKEIDRQHLAKAEPDAQSIKLADLIHNTSSIVEHDLGFARIYLAEKELLLKVLWDGNNELHEIASRALDAGLMLCDTELEQGR